MHGRVGAGLITGLVFLSGCANGAGPFGVGALVGNRTLAAAEPLFSDEQDQCLEEPGFLLKMLDGSRAATPETTPRLASRAGRKHAACEVALSDFRHSIDTLPRRDPSTAPAPAGVRKVGVGPDYTPAQRNEIIDALVAASNRKCVRYTAFLKSYDGSINSGLSIASIITAGLGSIVGPVSTAKALAGSSAIISGSRSALNEVHFTNQTIHVLASAYEKARRDQRREITNRQACPVQFYTLMRGFEDAMSYHGSCSIVTGLAAAASAVQRSEMPGLDVMKRQLAELSALRRQATQFTEGGSGLEQIDLPQGTIKAVTAAASARSDAQLKATHAEGEADAADMKFVVVAERYKASGVGAAGVTPAIPVLLQKEYDDAQALAAKARAKAIGARAGAAEADKRFSDELTRLATYPAQVRAAYDAEEAKDSSQIALCPFTPVSSPARAVPTMRAISTAQ